MRNPYIGITDFMNFKQVTQMLALFKAHLVPKSKRRLHVGVMMSYKTLNSLPTKWSSAFPPNEQIAEIFYSDETMNCLHFADYDDNPSLDATLYRAISYGGVCIDALQLDMIWPDPVQIANAIHASRKQIEVILQIGKNAIEEANEDPQQIIDRLWEYDGVIHYVLLDKSMGQGKGMDAIGLLPYVRAIKSAFPELGIAVAGGLGPKTMHLVEPIIKEFPDVSIDAQGKLRPSGSALDPVNWDMAGTYLVKALELLK